MTKVLRNILSIFLFAGTPAGIPVAAQNLTDTIIPIAAVSITGQRSLMDYAVSYSGIDTLDLHENLNHSLSELLSMYSPVYIKSYGQGSLATASFRGTSASHTQVNWNGLNINNPMVGQSDLSLIPVWFIDEISLLRGPSSLLQGVGALGGSIQLTSKPDWDKKIYGSVTQGIGSFGTCQTFASIGGGTSGLHIGIRLFHEQSKNNFTYFNNASGLWDYEKQKNADYTMDGILGELIYRKGAHTLSASVWLQGADRNLPPIMSYEGRGRIEYQKDMHTRGSLLWTHYGHLVKSRITSGYSKSNLEYFLAGKTDDGYLINYNSFSTAESFFNNYTAESKIGSQTLLRGTINYNFHLVGIADETSNSGFSADRSEAGAAASIHHQFNDKLAGFMLVRGELIDSDFSPVMPALGMEFQPFRKEKLSIKLNVGRNYHQPSMNDLYWIPGGNPDLLPEEGYSSDLTIIHKWESDSLFSLRSELSGYLTYVDNWILWQPGEYRFWQAENIKEVFARGFEYNLISSLKTGNLKVNFSGNYAFTRTTNINAEDGLSNNGGKQLIYIPVHKGSGTIYLSYKNLGLSYGIYVTGERFTTTSNEFTGHALPAYALHNISINRSFSLGIMQGEIRLKADNIWNTDYQAILWRPMPGRHYLLLVKMAF